MKWLVSLFVASLIGVLGVPPVAAEENGNDVLAKVDAALNSFTDGTFESKLRIKEPSGQVRELTFTTYQKVPDKRLVRFSAPGDVAGMGVLVENRDTMYVFLPGFQKVRRVGTHVKNQTFMGSDLSYEDMSQTRYAPTYEAKLVKADANGWELELNVRAGKDTEFPKLHMWVDKTAIQPSKIDFMDTSGKVLKTAEYLDYQRDAADHFDPRRVVVTDHRRNHHQSEIVFTGVKLNQGLKDELFSQRSLVRGR